jgi:hypothetical protein
MFLFRGSFGTRLHTGDFRWDAFLPIPRSPANAFQPAPSDSSRFAPSCSGGSSDDGEDGLPLTSGLRQLRVALRGGPVDSLFLDNTYCHPKYRFPKRAEALEQVRGLLYLPSHVSSCNVRSSICDLNPRRDFFRLRMTFPDKWKIAGQRRDPLVEHLVLLGRMLRVCGKLDPGSYFGICESSGIGKSRLLCTSCKLTFSFGPLCFATRTSICLTRLQLKCEYGPDDQLMMNLQA